MDIQDDIVNLYECGKMLLFMNIKYCNLSNFNAFSLKKFDKAGNENMSEATGVNTQLNYAPVFSRYSNRNSKN